MPYNKDNQGTLNKNDDKRNDKDRDYWGSAVIDGVEYWISGYLRQGTSKKTGQPYRFQNLTFKRKQQEDDHRQQHAHDERRMSHDDEDIPF